MSLRILFEDNHLIAVFKKPGQSVQPEPGKPLSLEEEVKEFIRIRDQKPGAVFLGVIHRLDMPVSGIVLFAKTSKALTRMNALFQKREVTKIYEALVENKPPTTSEHIVHWLRRDDKRHMTKAFVSQTSNTERAELIYTVLGIEGKFTRVRIELLTGRKHQIRAQLSAIGCPIAGDAKYGASTRFDEGEIKLSAIELSFNHPVKEELVIIRI